MHPKSFTIISATKEDISGIAKTHVDTWRTTYKSIVPDSYLNSLTYEEKENVWSYRNAEIKDFCWNDVPKRKLGPHDGKP